MYNRGLQSFINAKQLKPSQCINAFLRSEGITDFNYKNHNKVNRYIQKYWNKFANFIDKGIKNGTLKGKAVKLNTYYAEKRQYKQEAKEECSLLTKEEWALVKILKEHDDFTRLSKCHSFFNKRNIELPKPNSESLTRIVHHLPRIQFILNHRLYDEFIDYIQQP